MDTDQLSVLWAVYPKDAYFSKGSTALPGVAAPVSCDTKQAPW